MKSELFRSVAGHGHWALASSWLVLEPSRDAWRHQYEHFTQIKRGEVGFGVARSLKRGNWKMYLPQVLFRCQPHGKLYKLSLVSNI